ncbi:MAG: pH regulation protein F [Betaproteobacteria bacterium HGW-Betaproteobacteria-21]|nr:MAG: pH regulation protein F [Betaproteobacteria bacterium HGW-Betaproteobacteria-21]
MSVEIAGAAWLIPFAFAVQGLSAVVILIRLLKGPTGPDRVVAIDALTLLGAATLALLALHTGQAVLLDAAVVLALVSFIGTTAFVLLFATREAPDNEPEVVPDDEPNKAPETAPEER